VVAFPTDTFYALSCDPFHMHALDRLRHLKQIAQRPVPLLVPIGFDCRGLGCTLGRMAEELTSRFWPGKLTLIVPCHGQLAARVGRPSDGAVGLRAPGWPWTQDLLRAWGGPLVGTSANVTGRPPAVTPEDVRAQFGEDLQWVADQVAPGGAPSTVVDVSTGKLRVEREGAVSESALAPWLGA
jgi:tRNA threonylcarbamoyl adenosine modification protein (Sua5/YciO/YrdC/YwlC family)